MSTVRVIHGDCLDVMREMDSESIDACVTDPPSGIGFMQAKWDSDKGGRRQWVAWMTQVMEEVYRVLKPGAHGFVWALPKTSHWTGWALEDAGFEIREVHLHLFGQGYPKSTSISKRIDTEAGVVGTFGEPKSAAHAGWIDRGRMRGGDGHEGYQRPWMQDESAVDKAARQYEPATDAAKKWHGWGTATKPAAEFWWLVRKPISEKTIAQNVLRWSTGGLNIEACRVQADWSNDPSSRAFGYGFNVDGPRDASHSYGKFARNTAWKPTQGRWPANVVLSYPEDSYILRGDATVEQKKELYKWLHENA